MRHIRKRLTYANVMSSIAVFLVMGGAAFAATQLPKNSVGTKQLKNNAVNSAKVKNHSLKAIDFKAGQLPAGPQGPAGPAGKNGTGTPLFFKGPSSTGPTTIATLDGASIVAECDGAGTTHLILKMTSAHGVYHGQYDASGTATEVFADNLEPGGELNMLGGSSDYEGWFSYIGPSGQITTGIFGDDTGGSHSGDCLVWGNIESSPTGSTGGA